MVHTQIGARDTVPDDGSNVQVGWDTGYGLVQWITVAMYCAAHTGYGWYTGSTVRGYGA